MSTSGSVMGGGEFYERLKAARRQILADELARWNGNRRRTAQALGLERTHLLRMMRELGLQDYTRGAGSARVAVAR